MIWILLLMYVWAGATVAWSFRLFDEIEQAMDEALPFKESVATVKYSAGIALTIAALWPAVLPIWLLRRDAA
jgi:hypothetical protein